MRKTHPLKIAGIALFIIGLPHVFINNASPYHDPFQLTFAFGLLLYSSPKLLAKLKPKAKKVIYLFLSIVFSANLMAQDYSTQVEALKKSLAEKESSYLKEHIVPELKFDPIPVQNTPAILKNLVNNLPQLNKIEILKSVPGKALVRYDFQLMGQMESFIHFNTEGKITRIEFIENLIRQEIEQQKQLKESVQAPVNSPVTEKYIPVKIEFTTSDGLKVHGKLYEMDEALPVILLLHQAGYNSAEYLDIAPRLNELGYNCLAIDQRSGGSFANQPNPTAKAAQEQGLKTSMIEVRYDIQAAINYLSHRFNQKVILWGSSYSSSLALMEGVTNAKVKAVIAFSPGDYFGDQAPSLTKTFSEIEKPFFVTSSKSEAEALTGLLANKVFKSKQQQFIPKGAGFHGSRAVWVGQKGAEEYWSKLIIFLENIE